MFPAGFDAGHSNDTTNNQERIQEQDITSQIADGSANDWSHVNLQSFGINGDAEWSDDIGVDATGNGLYWFWDLM